MNLRFDYRERRDIARVKETRAICLSAMSGNKKVDAFKTADNVNELIDDTIDNIFPYYARKDHNSISDDTGMPDYSKYFKYLEELEAQEKQNSENNNDDTENNDDKD